MGVFTDGAEEYERQLNAQIDQLRKDLDLSETLRRGLERDNDALKAEAEKLAGDLSREQDVILDLEQTRTALHDRIKQLESYAEHADNACLQMTKLYVEKSLDAARRQQHLLEENSRLTDLKRAAEADLEQLKVATRAITEQKLAILVDRNRLAAGNLTPEEVQNLCHNLPATVPREEFEAGCRAYQDKLYGPKPPSAEETTQQQALAQVGLLDMAYKKLREQNEELSKAYDIAAAGCNANAKEAEEAQAALKAANEKVAFLSKEVQKAGVLALELMKAKARIAGLEDAMNPHDVTAAPRLCTARSGAGPARDYGCLYEVEHKGVHRNRMGHEWGGGS